MTSLRPADFRARSAAPTTWPGAIAQLARRTFDSLTTDQARAVLQAKPDAVAALRRSGPDPRRILCFGGGALRGLGLTDHNLGLPGHIADRVVEETGRGVHIDVVVDAMPTSARALALLAGLRIRRYDAVIVVLGDPEATPVPADRWHGAVVGLSQLLMSETSRAAGVFIYDSGRAIASANPANVLSRNAAAWARLTPVTEQVCCLTGRIRFGELRPTLGTQDASGRFSSGTYTDWAEQLVSRMQPTFAALDTATEADSPKAFRNRPEDERFRQRALDTLRLRRGKRDRVLDRELGAAKSMYHANHAVFNVIDGDEQWAMASTEETLPITPRPDAFCNFAIGSDELTLINDTWLDPRSRSSPLARGRSGTRFYAGYPVHSIDGYRVGMVCILGTSPRTLRPRELEGLRDVAARVEQRLWNSVLHGPPTA